MAAILLRNGSQFNVTPHPLSNPKRVSKLLPNIMRPQLNERVQVQFDRTSLSPATIVSLDSRHDNSEDGSYLVRLALTDQIVRVTSDQVQRLQITLMKKPPMTSSTNLPKLVGPTRHQLEWYQLEIKALCYCSDIELARAWRKWAGVKEERRQHAERINAKKQALAEADAAAKAARNELIFGQYGGILGKLQVTILTEQAYARQQWMEERIAIQPEAARMHDALKKGANAAWVNDETTVCKQLLDNCIKLNGHCDTLFSYRARVNARAGLTCEAINDARRAVSLWHRPENHMLLSRLLQREKRLDEARSHFMAAQQRGGDGLVAASDENGYSGLVSDIRRKRNFYSGRPFARGDCW